MKRWKLTFICNDDEPVLELTLLGSNKNIIEAEAKMLQAKISNLKRFTIERIS